MGFEPAGTLVVPTSARVQELADPTTTALQTHKSESGPLFTRQPCKDDVVQGEIGDCYLLAAINAIITRPEGPDIIQAIFRDSGNGSVIIRLYQGGSYHYLRIKKTVVREYEGKLLGVKYGTGKVLHGQGALWVSLLEKAYTSFMRTAPVGTPTTYKSLEGGAGMTAMAAIVGGGEGSSNGSALPEVTAIRDTLFQLTQELSIANNLHTNIPKLRMQAVNKIADDVFADVDQKAQHATNWMQWNTGVTVEEFRRFFMNGPSLERFHRLMSDLGSGLDATTRELVIAWVERWAPELWPGEVGSGLYTTEQLNYFMKIQRLLATHRGVTAPTLDKLAGPVSGSGRSAGEAKVVGLAAKHEYTVLDTKSDHLGRRFIQVRNPWGEYGRSYQTEIRSTGQKGPALLKPVADEKEAEPWIELTDFTNNFGGINAGPPVHGANRQAFMSELQSRLAKVKDGNTGLKSVSRT